MNFALRGFSEVDMWDPALRQSYRISALAAFPWRQPAMGSQKNPGRRTHVPDQEIRQRVDRRLEELYRRHLSLHDDKIVNYYASGLGYLRPEDAQTKQQPFAICLATTDGEVFSAGDHDLPFALQSISKVFVHGLALEACGRDRVLERVGVEPSGDAFNSIVFDERNNRPHNPMVNAGALATTNLVKGAYAAGRPLERILGVLRRYAGNRGLEVDEVTFGAEMRTADRNRATAYLKI